MYTLQCLKIIEETPDVKTFIFKDKAQHTIPYYAGQHLPISVNIEGKEVSRCYTLSSSPTRPRHIALTIKRVEDGIVSNFLHDHFNVGDTLNAQQPGGEFHLNNIKREKLLMLSAGSGVTPMLAMLRALVDDVSDRDVIFFHSAHTERDLICAEEVAELARQQGNCQLRYTLTREANSDWQGLQGRINGEMFADISDLADREVMVCGPQGFRDQAKKLLMELGLPTEQFHQESFGFALVSGEESSPAKQIAVAIRSNEWPQAIEGNNQQSILDQIQNAGEFLPYSCKAGACGCCKVRLLKGEVKQLSTDALTDKEQQQGYILACSSIPQTDVELFAEDVE